MGTFWGLLEIPCFFSCSALWGRSCLRAVGWAPRVWLWCQWGHRFLPSPEGGFSKPIRRCGKNTCGSSGPGAWVKRTWKGCLECGRHLQCLSPKGLFFFFPNVLAFCNNSRDQGFCFCLVVWRGLYLLKIKDVSGFPFGWLIQGSNKLIYQSNQTWSGHGFPFHPGPFNWKRIPIQPIHEHRVGGNPNGLNVQKKTRHSQVNYSGREQAL